MTLGSPTIDSRLRFCLSHSSSCLRLVSGLAKQSTPQESGLSRHFTPTSSARNQLDPKLRGLTTALPKPKPCNPSATPRPIPSQHFRAFVTVEGDRGRIIKITVVARVGVQGQCPNNGDVTDSRSQERRRTQARLLYKGVLKTSGCVLSRDSNTKKRKGGPSLVFRRR